MEASPESGAACVLEALLSLGPEPLTAHGSHSELPVCTYCVPLCLNMRIPWLIGKMDTRVEALKPSVCGLYCMSRIFF